MRKIGTSKSIPTIPRPTLRAVLRRNSGHQNDQDVVWNDGTPFDLHSQDGGGWYGGEISRFGAKATYQANAKSRLTHWLKQGRGVSDIAMSATNYFTRVDSRRALGNLCRCSLNGRFAAPVESSGAKTKNVDPESVPVCQC